MFVPAVYPCCGPAQLAGGLLAQSKLTPVLLVAMAAVSVMHLFRFGELQGKPGWLVGAWLMLAALFVSPLCALSSALFSGLIMWVPASIPYRVGALPLVGRRLTGAATAGRTS